MDNKNGAGPGALEKFFAGKGFYVVLAVCAAVIGVSAWSLFSGGGADDVIDVYAPAATASPRPTAGPREDEVIAVPPEHASETPKVQATPAPTPAAAPAPTPRPVSADSAPENWIKPVSGAVDVPHSLDALRYDVTMGDWRTHDGVDLTAQLGEHVLASAAGTVTDIRDDPLYGTTVVIGHGGGYESEYSNLAALPTVEIGDTVGAGEVIGAVGDTAICETGQVFHLHYAMRHEGESVNPMDFIA